MFIHHLALKNFRNYESLELKFNKHVNIILGENAQGKTNLVESLYVLGFGKSFRTTQDKDLILMSQVKMVSLEQKIGAMHGKFGTTSTRGWP